MGITLQTWIQGPHMTFLRRFNQPISEAYAFDKIPLSQAYEFYPSKLLKGLRGH